MALGTVALEALRVLRLRRNEVDSRLQKFDRSGRLLAWLVRGEQQRGPIRAIRLDSGAAVNTQAEINDTFKQYYSTLYAVKPPPPTAQLTDFFHTLPLAQLSIAQQRELEKPIDVEEIQLATTSS
ncbi:hypothetical protein NDU88_003841 [Pleurodeles waltl]|uniref:Uncharacterized protein n=1 Tax=Pleurodeles waltl TaxID=8319 RepID=A0AAV7TQQ6_PLEWA|nr:hypothetical protein NDU88_003841 [Pleurodeles waltl]